MHQLAVPISLVALAVSFSAFIFLVISVLRKSGLKLRANLIECSSRACDDKFFSKITIENLKDKSVVIFKIYVKFSHNIYLEIQDFEEDPLILKPYEVFTKSYDPLDFYTTGTDRIRLNKFFDDKTRRKIILSTSEGKYSVKPKSKRWSPYRAFFSNVYTGIISPVRSTYDGVAYGGNALFIVEFTNKNDSSTVLAIYPGDDRLKLFKNFQLTEESLSSAQELEVFLEKQKQSGKVLFTDFKIHDLKKWSQENRRQNIKDFEAERITWFKYNIIGRVLSKLRSFQLFRQNKKIKEGNKQKSSKEQVPRHQEVLPQEDNPENSPKI